jgi:ubiquinone/menaquinone biosynthesis C-methylase UbiE
MPEMTGTLPDWRLPTGVSRSLWEYIQDAAIADREDDHVCDSPLAVQDLQVVRECIPGGSRVIDLGCGSGRVAVPLLQHGCEVIGVDLSWPALHAARKRADSSGLSLPVVRANLVELDAFANATFDAAVLMFGTLGMLNGLEARVQTLRHVRRLLKPGGTLVLHVHRIWGHAIHPQGRWWLIRDLGRRLIGSRSAGNSKHDYRGIPGMDHHAFSDGEIRRLLRQTGFAPKSWRPVDTARESESSRPGSREADSLWRRLWTPGWIIAASAN